MSRFAYGVSIPATGDGPQCDVAQRTAEANDNRLHGVERELLFRVEAVRYSGCSLTEWGGEEYYTTAPRLEVFCFPVLRWTPYGATLEIVELPGCRNKWVDLRSDAKQFASRTVQEAVDQFAERRRRQLYILARQQSRAEQELALLQPLFIGIPA